MVKKIKIYAFMTILFLFLLSAINASFSVAISMQGNGATIKVEKDDPIGYGVFMQDPNLFTATSIGGYHQGQFTIMDHNGNQMAQENVNIPGNDISVVYPWYFDNYIMDSTTNNNYTDPWLDIGWLNVSAHDAENDTLSPYSFNTVWNSYSMSEGSILEVPLNSTIPVQVDIAINTIGPKLLKVDSLNNDMADIIASHVLISPSGKVIKDTLISATGIAPLVFKYISFIAHEAGTYKLLLKLVDTVPAYLLLEFLNFNLATLATDVLTLGGKGDTNPSYQDFLDAEWNPQWYRFSGLKGDKFRLDLGLDYVSAMMGPPTPPAVDLWYPCSKGYLLSTNVGFGTHDIYLPSDGDFYIHISDGNYMNLYRYSLLLTKIESSDYTIGGNLTTIKVSRDERKALDFTVEDDSFVRINYTAYGLGNPLIAGFDYNTLVFISNATTFLDAKKISCVEAIIPLETKRVGTKFFHYYYMPAGRYEVLIKNTDVRYDGVIQISSEYITHNNNTIPINNLVYPDTNPSTFQSITFTPDDYYTSLKDAQWIEINITEPGQYRLNTTIWAADNPGAAATGSPTYLYTYNQSATPQYTDSAYPIWAFGNDGGMGNDYFYIGSPCRYTGMIINFSTPGDLAGDHDMQVYDGSWTNGDLVRTDGTLDLTQDGIIEFDTTGSFYRDWVKGAGGIDFPDITDEDNYYWLRLDCDAVFTPVPVISLITLLNITISGDINFALLRDSGYQYCDYWGPDQPGEPNGLRVSLDEGLDGWSQPFNFDSSESYIIETVDPHTIGFETGVYKLLIVPEKWCYAGSVTIRFAVENLWNYNVFAEYNITAEPSLHAGYINNYTASGYGIDNATIYPYGLVSTFNDTLVEATGEGYLILKCYGKPYHWTQAVVAMQNVSDYELYIMQDLPWIDNSGPNDEVKKLLDTVTANITHEFGVFNEVFYLIFEYEELAGPNHETITFRIALSQYNTTAIYTEGVIAEIGVGIDPVMVGLIIIIVAIIGGAAVVVVVILKKKGRI